MHINVIVLGVVAISLGAATLRPLQAQQSQSLPYEATFESENGFAAGSVDRQRGFSVVRGEAQVRESRGRAGSAGLELHPSRPFGIVQLSIDANLDEGSYNDRVVHTEFYVRPGAIGGEESDQFADVEGSLTGFFKIDDAGELHIYDGSNGSNGDDGNGGQWLPTGTRFTLDEAGNAEDWIHLAFRQDFGNGLWDVAINGNIFRANLAMSQQADTLETIEFIGQSRMPLYLDDVRVSRDALAFEDTDRDGLPDAWERVRELPSGKAGRDDDPDGDGLSNVEEWVLATSPTTADSDGDGVNDGDEYVAGTNPLGGEDGPEAAAQTAQSGELVLTALSCGETYAGFQVSLYGGYYESITGFYYLYAYSVPDYQTLNPSYQYVSGGVGNVWLNTTTYVPNGRLDVAVTTSLGNTYSGSFGFSCECGCGCLDVWSVGSVDFQLVLGSKDYGRFGQYLQVKEPTWTDRVYSRSSVRYAGPPESKGISMVGDVPVLDWVKTDTQFTKLSDLPHGYLVESYHLDQINESHEVSGEPFKRYRIENPDPQGLERVKRLRVMEEIGRPSVREYRFHENHGVEEWELYEGAIGSHLERPLRYTKMTSTSSNDGSTYKSRPNTVEFHEKGHWDEATGQLVLDEVTKRVYRQYPFGKKLVEETRDPGGENLTTRYGYLEDFEEFDPEENPGGFAQLQPQWEERPDGGWVWYGYNEMARRDRVVTPVGNTPRPDHLPDPGEGYRVVQTDYLASGLKKRVTESVNGVTESVTTTTQLTMADGLVREVVELQRGNEIESTISFKDAKTNRLVRQENHDGSIVTVDLVEEGDIRTETRFAGAADGSFGTVTSTRTHRSGLVMEKKVTDVKSSVVTQHEKVLEHDGRYRATLTANELTGRIASVGYDCCDEAWKTRENGSAAIYDRDVLGRIIGARTGYKDPLGLGNVLDVVTSESRYRLDGLDRRILTERLSEDGKLASSSVYNLAGQRTASTTPDGVETRHKTIMFDDGGRMELTSLPRSGHDQRHRITSQTFDVAGKLVRERVYAAKSLFATEPEHGTQTRNMVYEEGRDEGGPYTQVIDIANLFDRRITRTYLNEAGQRREVIQAYGSPLEANEKFEYNDRGLLMRHIDPDGVTTRYGYNAEGERTITAIDLKIEPGEAADHIDFEVDRITRITRQLATSDEGLEVQRTTTEVFTANGPVLTSVTEQSLDGSYNATIQNNMRAVRRRVEGEAPGEWTVISTKSDGSDTVQAFAAGRLVRSTRRGSNGAVVSWTSLTYDGHGRPVEITDSRTGTTTYYYDDNGRCWKVCEPNPTTGSSTNGTLDTLFHYDALGQLLTTTKPSGGQVHQIYNANGTLHGTYGHQVTDVHYRYNGRGERTHLITYYGPENTPAETRWAFNARGQLAFKQDAHGKRVHYTYTSGGKLKTRTWARGVITTYGYDGDNHVDLRSIDYSDATPDVYFTYTRLGQKKTVEDAGGLTTYVYRDDNPTELHFETSGTELYAEPKVLTYTRDTYHRPSGFQIGTIENLNKDYAVGYGYDVAGRLESVHGQGYWFFYNYEPNSTTDRVKTVTAPFVKQTEFVYERGRDAIVSVQNRVGFRLNQELSRFDYTINADGQRTARITSRGDANRSLEDSFTYDSDTGGVISSRRSGGEVGQIYTYAYDKIGNRQSASANGLERRYDANGLNQYSAIGKQAPSYDADGNLIAKGERTYTWDAENRVIAIFERGSLVAEYTYDHQSRRIARKTREGVDELYLYQGWNLIAVYEPEDSEPLENYTWGKDLSGSLQGAGGVGGLLFARMRDQDEDVWIYHYDANGNVGEVTDAEGALLGRYSYDPFGNQHGRMEMPENRFRFSTQVQDNETGNYYYGYRYYDPTDGRWISRDPLEETGGVLLSGFVGNDPINNVDVNGQNPLIVGALFALGVNLGYEVISYLCNNDEWDTVSFFKNINWWQVGLSTVTGAGLGVTTGQIGFFAVETGSSWIAAYNAGLIGATIGAGWAQIENVARAAVDSWKAANGANVSYARVDISEITITLNLSDVVGESGPDWTEWKYDLKSGFEPMYIETWSEREAIEAMLETLWED